MVYPAVNDTLVFTDDVKRCIDGLPCEGCVFSDPHGACEIVSLSGERYQFVMRKSPGKAKARTSVEIHLTEALPSFDSVLLYRGIGKKKQHFLVVVHCLSDHQKNVPESIREHFVEPEVSGKYGHVLIQVYGDAHHMSLREWREQVKNVSPKSVLSILERIAVALNDICKKGHALFRFSPDTIDVSGNSVRFMGVHSIGFPWDETAVSRFPRAELAAVPPECRIYMCRPASMLQCVYAFGALAFFLIAGVDMPTCEALDYEPALEPRAFNPAFPIGWDALILKAVSAVPVGRFISINAFLDKIRAQYKVMQMRMNHRDALSYDAAVDTHIGITKCLHCPVNQDVVLMHQSADGQRILMVVGDGISTATYGSGDIASHLLAEAADEVWTQQMVNCDVIEPRQLAADILNRANEAINDYIDAHFADQNPQSSECMGSTAIVAIIEKNILTLASIGDSRAYIIRDEDMACITRDHNLYTVGILNGIPVETCALHAHAASIVQCLGYARDEEGNLEPLNFDTYQFRLIPGDHLLITTDGVLDYIDRDVVKGEQRIASTILSGNRAAIACLELILLANIGGGGDNCGLGIVHVNAAAKKKNRQMCEKKDNT